MLISEAFTKFGSDKNTEHSYGEFYDNLMQRLTVVNVLEIGVEAGYSMQAWKLVLPPEAIVIGVDADVESTPVPRIRDHRKRNQAVKMKRADPQMMRFGHALPPYRRPPGLDVIQTITPNYQPVIDRCRRDCLKFDLIIDDGSHIENDQVLGWHYLHEFLNPGGEYVIEDIQSYEIMRRFAGSGWNVCDLREKKNRWDDVIVYREAP